MSPLQRSLTKFIIVLVTLLTAHTAIAHTCAEYVGSRKAAGLETIPYTMTIGTDTFQVLRIVQGTSSRWNRIALKLFRRFGTTLVISDELLKKYMSGGLFFEDSNVIIVPWTFLASPDLRGMMIHEITHAFLAKIGISLASVRVFSFHSEKPHLPDMNKYPTYENDLSSEELFARWMEIHTELKELKKVKLSDSKSKNEILSGILNKEKEIADLVKIISEIQYRVSGNFLDDSHSYFVMKANSDTSVSMGFQRLSDLKKTVIQTVSVDIDDAAGSVRIRVFKKLGEKVWRDTALKVNLLPEEIHTIKSQLKAAAAKNDGTSTYHFREIFPGLFDLILSQEKYINSVGDGLSKMGLSEKLTSLLASSGKKPVDVNWKNRIGALMEDFRKIFDP